MEPISSTIQKELEQRMASGSFNSIDDLLRSALRALDNAQDIAHELLEKELLQGLDGGDVEMTSAEWDDIEQQARNVIEAKKPR